MEASLDQDVLAARTGDRDAFARLVTRYRGLVASISLSTVRNVAASEDVAQEVFLAAWRDLGTLRNPSSFLPWLRQLTRHRALDAARAGKRAALDDDAIEAAVDPRPDAQDALLGDERSRAVVLALEALPDDAREVITLYYREGRSIEQVARLLGLRDDTAKKRLSRARAALRDEVLARFADAVESSAPGDELTSRVMMGLPMMSPAATAVAGKGALHLVSAWTGLTAASFASLVGLFAGGVPIVSTLRRDLALAVDEHERSALRKLSVAALVNLAVFSLTVAGRVRTSIGIASTIVFTAVHLAIYVVWMPRAKARRRAAEVAADPSAAERHAAIDRRQRFWATVACAIVGVIVVAAWIRG